MQTLRAKTAAAVEAAGRARGRNSNEKTVGTSGEGKEGTMEMIGEDIKYKR